MGWFRPTWASCGTADWSQLLASRTPPRSPWEAECRFQGMMLRIGAPAVSLSSQTGCS